MTWLVVLAALALLAVAIASLASVDERADARAAIAKQVELIKKVDVDALRLAFTPRLRGQITKDLVKAAGQTVGKMTIDDLVGSATLEMDQLKVRMRNGKPLTTLVYEDGAWLADTLWFK